MSVWLRQFDNFIRNIIIEMMFMILMNLIENFTKNWSVRIISQTGCPKTLIMRKFLRITVKLQQFGNISVYKLHKIECDKCEDHTQFWWIIEYQQILSWRIKSRWMRHIFTFMDLLIAKFVVIWKTPIKLYDVSTTGNVLYWAISHYISYVLFF